MKTYCDNGFKIKNRIHHRMKHSDSKSSLAELNHDDVPCFICLEIENELAEPLVNSAILRTCGCKFAVHPYCWNAWMKDKSSYDCPICRQKSMFTTRAPTPLAEFLAPPTVIRCNITLTVLCITILIIAFTLFGLYSK